METLAEVSVNLPLDTVAGVHWLPVSPKWHTKKCMAVHPSSSPFLLNFLMSIAIRSNKAKPP